MLKLYKFRSLGDGCKNDPHTDTPLGRAETILESGKFYCSSLWEMNDPMEGIFSFEPGAFPGKSFDDIFPASNKRGLCSFSGEKAFKLPTMWGYYANGFKGIAIEIEVKPDDVAQVTYLEKLPTWKEGDDRPNGEILIKILTTKMKTWIHEDEYRFICKQFENGNRKIGEIKAVHFGWAYKHVSNVREIHANSPALRSYVRNMNLLYEVAKGKKIPCFEASLDGDQVISRDSFTGKDLP